MAEAEVESLLEKLKQLRLHQTNLIKDASSQIEKLETQLRLLRVFLNDTLKGRRNDGSLQKLFRQIRAVVYKAEDVTDTFVTEATAKRYSIIPFRRTPKKLTMLDRITVDVDQVIDEFRLICDNVPLNIDSYSAKDEYKEMPLIREEKLVGLEEDARVLIKYLTEETEELDIITIVGKSGLGKTTLAQKIFYNATIDYEFPIRIWADVSEDFKMKDVLLSILRDLSQLSDNLKGKSELELAEHVARYLEKEKFLIVMDDVWTIDDWNKLQLALPKTNPKGKVLMTSCKEEVGRGANYNREPYKLRLLSHEEGWRMLQLLVFDKLDVCPPDLEPLGQLIVEQCGGMPLAIAVMGDIIAKEYSKLTDMGKKIDAWRQACKSVHIHLSRRFYDQLPNHLRACFLYFGMFPKDYEIPAWKLTRMWIAEGFVQAKQDFSLEETAEYYLYNLVDSSLVTVAKRKADGGIKTCRIHGTLHDFCRFEAGKERENIFHEIDQSGDANSEVISTQVSTNRRLCIHSNVLDFLSSSPDGPHVRSFVSFSKNEVNLPDECSEAIASAFTLLRVADVRPIKFTKIHKDMFQMVHLRYLVLSLDMNVLTQALDKLWNLQTLVVYTTSPTLEIQADIWKLSHLMTNVSTTLPRTGKSIKEGGQLQTLATISPRSCTKEFLERASSLKKLGIRGRLSLLLEGNTNFFDGFGRLSNLRKLKLANDIILDEGKLHDLHLPPAYKFPPKLRSLTLAHTCLEWTQMSILGMLDNLEVLKLKDKAFKGPKWEVADGGFRSLQVLHIEGSDLAVWEASANHFPRLRWLNLRNCEKLQQVPIGLANIPNLQHLDLYNTKLAVASAKAIHEKKQKIPEDQGIKSGEFKLSISSPSE